MTKEQIMHMVDRFLGWRLPQKFAPDAGISFQPEFNKEFNARNGLPPQRHEPIGTNLFDAEQAEAMVRFMVDGLPEGPLIEELRASNRRLNEEISRLNEAVRYHEQRGADLLAREKQPPRFLCARCGQMIEDVDVEAHSRWHDKAEPPQVVHPQPVILGCGHPHTAIGNSVLSEIGKMVRCNIRGCRSMIVAIRA